ADDYDGRQQRKADEHGERAEHAYERVRHRSRLVGSLFFAADDEAVSYQRAHGIRIHVTCDEDLHRGHRADGDGVLFRYEPDIHAELVNLPDAGDDQLSPRCDDRVADRDSGSFSGTDTEVDLARLQRFPLLQVGDGAERAGTGVACQFPRGRQTARLNGDVSQVLDRDFVSLGQCCQLPRHMGDGLVVDAFRG